MMTKHGFSSRSVTFSDTLVPDCKLATALSTPQLFAPCKSQYRIGLSLVLKVQRVGSLTSFQHLPLAICMLRHKCGPLTLPRTTYGGSPMETIGLIRPATEIVLLCPVISPAGFDNDALHLMCSQWSLETPCNTWAVDHLLQVHHR